EAGERELDAGNDRAIEEGRRRRNGDRVAEQVDVMVRSNVELVGGLADLPDVNPHGRDLPGPDEEIDRVVGERQVRQLQVRGEDTTRGRGDGDPQDRRVRGAVLGPEAELEAVRDGPVRA